MTSPKFAVDVNGTRKYRNPLERHMTYDSVTWAVGGGVPAYGLNAAKLKLSIEYAMDHADEWGALSSRDDQIRQIRNASERAWRPARERGTSVHNAIDRLLKGDTGAGFWVEGIAPYLEAFAKFVVDFEPVFGHAELTVYNNEHRYAGTLDAVMTSRNMPRLGVCLLDWKTGTRVRPDYALQLSAYAHADYGVDETSEAKVLLPAFERGLIVHLTPEGYSVHPVVIDKRSQECFLAALRMARFGRMSKELLGEPIDPAVRGHEWDVPYLMQRIAALDIAARTRLSITFVQMSIPTVPAQWSQVHIEQIGTLLQRVEPEQSWI